jgi:hypothetical protein
MSNLDFFRDMHENSARTFHTLRLAHSFDRQPDEFMGLMRGLPTETSELPGSKIYPLEWNPEGRRPGTEENPLELEDISSEQLNRVLAAIIPGLRYVSHEDKEHWQEYLQFICSWVGSPFRGVVCERDDETTIEEHILILKFTHK